jgi:zinc D-Ala-D-Ala carboxypeptidase
VRYFKAKEFDCKHCGANRMNHVFLDRVDMLRDTYQFPLIVSSGYRCPEHNAAVSSTGLTGPHTTGRAVDLLIARGEAFKLLRLAMEPRFGFTGIGVNQKGGARFIHLDDLPNAPGQPRPTIWSY